jgi:hypothetical protein
MNLTQAEKNPIAPPLEGDGHYFFTVPDAGFRRFLALKNDNLEDTLALVELCGKWMEAHGVRRVLGDDRCRSYEKTVEQMHRVGQAVATAWRGIDAFAMLQPRHVSHGHGSETAINRGVSLMNFYDEEAAVAHLENFFGENRGPENLLKEYPKSSLVAEGGVAWLRHRQSLAFDRMEASVIQTGRIASEKGLRRLYVYDGSRSDALSPAQMLAMAAWAGKYWNDFEKIAIVYPEAMRRGEIEDQALRLGSPMRVFSSEPEALAWIRS